MVLLILSVMDWRPMSDIVLIKIQAGRVNTTTENFGEGGKRT